MDNIDNIINAIFSRKNVVVITGAGISTLSGIPDFRGKNGLYTKNMYTEEKLSHEYLYREPEHFYEFYTKYMIIKDKEPNIIHETLAKLENKGYITCIITQNIDGLHQKAGSKNVIALHGDKEKFYCTHCKKEYTMDYYLEKGFMCEECKGLVRPNVVLYNEAVSQKRIEKAYESINKADIIIVLGSSLTVSTVGRLLTNFIIQNKNNKDKKIFIVNDQETQYDYYAETCKEDLEKVFKKIKKFPDLNI